MAVSSGGRAPLRRDGAERLALGLLALGLGRLGQGARVEVGVARGRRRRADAGAGLGVLGRSSSSATTSACWSTHMTTRSPGLVRAMTWRDGLELVEDDLDLPAAGALRHRGPRALGHERGRLAGLAPAQALVLADDDDVEVLRRPRHPARACRRRGGRPLRRSCRCATSGRGRTAPPSARRSGRRRRRAPSCRPRCGSSRRRRRRCHLDEVEAAGGEVVASWRRCAGPGGCRAAGAGGEGRARGRERVGDVEAGRAAERRRQQVRPGELHAAPAVLDDDHLAAVARLEHDGTATATAVVVDELADLAAGLRHREPDDRRPSTGGASCARAGRRR